MAAKAKVTVSVDAELLRMLSAVSRRTRTPRSRLVEEALRAWRRQQLEEALREGYQAMAAENRATARRYLRAVRDAVR